MSGLLCNDSKYKSCEDEGFFPHINISRFSRIEAYPETWPNGGTRNSQVTQPDAGYVQHMTLFAS
ncbi:hypothetical protein BELL_1203g00020 [Botrytis elliptica]|uniref:Uncharacterized protein n=1 Tax=Botrytis elliptica TaxID=278938 RepID=A0A4Z1IFM7_9HELO|nr:hypothetical protein BELL_1203g00020 [Botrytis elliptica]